MIRALLGILASIAFAVPAAAHVGLVYPPSRYGQSILKFPPCGLGGGQRSNNVTTFEPGATIDIVWDEYIDHPGHFRVAFDADGDDDFDEPACLSGCNSRMPVVELYSNEAVLLDGIADTPQGGPGGTRITLPDIECNNCTLQVMQVMYDKPPYRLNPGDDLYYQCADLVLRRSVPLTATPTPSPTPSAESPTPSPSPSLPAEVCPGDCDRSRDVTVDEIVTLVAIALGTSEVTSCAYGDSDGSGAIEVNEIVAALLRSLDGCGM
jgi:hypothetical protein